MQGRLYFGIRNFSSEKKKNTFFANLSFQDRFFNFLPVSMEMAKTEIFTIFSQIFIKLHLFSISFSFLSFLFYL